jgi:hypothetical protein
MSDWLPSVLGTVVSVAAIWSGVRIARSGHKHDAQMAVARSNRRWHRERRAEAYVAQLKVVAQVGAWVGVVHPMWDTDPPRPVPEAPTHAEQRDALALLQAFGSRHVFQCAETWGEIVRAVLLQVDDIARGVNGARDRLDALRGEERTARHQLAEAIRADLAEEPHAEVPAPREAEQKPVPATVDE